jgi:predicted membrane protein (TIGR00267 family)
LSNSLRIGPDTRKFFINTIFDSTFTLLGVISGLAFTTNPINRIIILTSVSSSLALGISSGVSVYEAEVLEEEKKLNDLETAMLTDLEDTVHFKTMQRKALISAVIAFITPLVACTIAVSPFILTSLGYIPIKNAAWASIALALVTLFTVGAYMSRNNDVNPVYRGARMALFGAGAFLLSVLLESIIG